MVELLGIFGFLVVLLRAAILCFQTVVVGGVLFLLIIARGASREQAEFAGAARKLIRWSALGLIVSQLFFVIANSLVLTSSTGIPLAAVLHANFALAGMVAILAGISIAVWPRGGSKTTLLLLLPPALLVLAASVMTSHSASRVDGRLALVTLTGLHYLFTASWIGGLPFLLLAMKRLPDASAKAQVSARFSRVALVSVAMLFLAGLAMSLEYVGSWDAIYGTAYGVMVSTKVILFGCLLVLGAANSRIVRSIGAGQTDGAKSLLRYCEAEIGIGLTIILAAASLTSQPPGADLVQDRVTLQEIATRFAPRPPRLSSPEWKELSEPTKQANRRALEEGKSVPQAFVPGQTEDHPSSPGDIAWSEYNHNWAGLIVFLMAILALLSRSRYFPWAKMWPLTFLGLAVFLFLRADPENWPLGPNGFWESFSEAEVLQHRLAVVLIILFALFQWAVETGRLKSHAAALVFPGVCALGGLVLLTHTHALGNIKEEMLAELSHTPLAICGVIAGWSRWLELRLPEENRARKALAWVWPVCFILIGLILMDYHES